MLPMIGVCPLFDARSSRIWMRSEYLQAVEEAGGVPVVLPLTTKVSTIESLLDRFDGFLLTGGQDVDPAIYGQKKKSLCGEVCAERDALERLVIQGAESRDKPLLGICRGIQILNATLGGTLYQDLPTEHPGVEHDMEPPYDRAIHRVFVLEGTPLADIVGSGSIEVNSYHHQAIRDLVPSLQVSAVSEDGIVEAVWMPGKRFFQAVQWHPETLYRKEEKCRRLIEVFVRVASEN